MIYIDFFGCFISHLANFRKGRNVLTYIVTAFLVLFSVYLAVLLEVVLAAVITFAFVLLFYSDIFII